VCPPASWSKRTAGTVALACVAAIATVVGLAVDVAPTAVASGATSSRVPPRCKTSGLDVWFNNEAGGGTAGSVFYKIEFTNLSRHACTLKGYPKVSAVNLRGRRLGSAASLEGSGRPPIVRLAVGASAAAPLRIVDAGNFSPSDCDPVIAAGLRVYPPGQRTSSLVPFPFEACSGVGHGNLAVRAVQSSAG
jgi:hypothetical protein